MLLGFELQLLLALFGHALGVGPHLGLEQLLAAAGPGTLAEDVLHVFGKDDLALHQQLGQLGVALGMLGQYLLGAGVLLVDHLQHLLVDHLGGGVGVGALELILSVVVVADVGQLVAHAGVGNHAVGLLRGALQVVHGARGDMAYEQLLGSASA